MANGPKRRDRRLDDRRISGGKAFQKMGRRRGAEPAPDDPNYRFNYRTGRREPLFVDRGEKNPLDVKQFPDPLPGEMERDLRRNRPGLPPFELPSDFPEPGKNIPEGFDPEGDIQRMRRQIDATIQDRGLRDALEGKKKKKRKEAALEQAMQRRGRRNSRRIFRDPQNLNRFIQDSQDRREDNEIARMQAEREIDMDDTIVDGPDGQQFRYDSEVDAFTPVNFNPRTNRYESALPEEEKDSGGSGRGGGSGSGSSRSAPQTEAFKIAKSAFDKQMTELKNLADKDQQFGDMYQELQGEYLEILRDPNLREEERQGALQDLFDRGASTFSATSGFARQAAEQKTQQEAAEAKKKFDDDIAYRNRRASDAKQKIRDKQEDQRIDDAKTREKFSETTQKATADYNAYLEQQKVVNQYKQDNDQLEIDDEGNPIIPPPLSREEFLMERYKQEHTDRVVQETVREIDVDISLLETEIGQIEETDPMEYRMQLTQIYGEGKQEYADAAFEAHLRERDARIVNNRKKIAELKLRRAEALERPMVAQEAEYAARKKAEKETGRDLGRVVESQQKSESLRAGALDEVAAQQEEQHGAGVFGREGLFSNTAAGRAAEGLYNNTMLGRMLRDAFNEGTSEAADVEADTSKLLARDAAVERDMNRTLEDGSPNPNFGKVTSMDTPNYVAQELGERTTLGDLRRLAHPDSAKKYFQGDLTARNKKESEVIRRLNPIIQKMYPDLEPDSGEFNTARREYYDRIIAKEQSFHQEQAGSRG
jgi:hypothetical protein